MKIHTKMLKLFSSGLLVLAFSCLAAPRAHGTEIMWLKIAPIFAYKDVSTSCSTSPSSVVIGQLYFGAEVENMVVKRASLKDNTIEVITDRIYFDERDLKGIELFRDKRGRLWLKTLPLSVRLLNWVFINADSGSTSECKLPQSLLTLGPAPYTFDFDVEGLWESLSYSDSRTGKFGGQRKDGTNYAASLRFTQEQFPSSQNNRSNAASRSGRLRWE